MPHRREAFGRPAADALGRRIDRDEIGMIALEVLQLAQQRVELGVGDLRGRIDVVALFVMADLLAEFAMRVADPRRQVNRAD